MTTEQLARFVAKVDALPSGCWEWQASRLAKGYGQFRSSSLNSSLAHRTSYEYFVGDIADGTEIDHLCRNRACVNPTHLEAVSHSTNVKRGLAPAMVALASRVAAARRTTYRCGHPVAGNSYFVQRRSGPRFRLCRICRIARSARQREQVA